MISLKEVDKRLAKIGHHNTFWGRPEVKELQHILTEEEEICHAVIGRYENGFALLVATDRRLLLIDKKPMFLSMEDLRYDMISEVDFISRLLDATVSVQTINKTLIFNSYRQAKLRKLTTYMQQKVMELRQHSQDFQAQLQQPQVQQVQQPQMPQALAEQPIQFANYPAQQSSVADPRAMAVNPPATFYQRTNPYPPLPFTVRRRISRFYPSK